MNLVKIIVIGGIIVCVLILVILLLCKAFGDDGGGGTGGGTSPKEREYSLPSEDQIAFRSTKMAIVNANVVVRNIIRISPNWYQDIQERYQRGYNLYMNSLHPVVSPSSKNYAYFKGLYYRSVNGGKLLHEVEKDCQRKVSELQTAQKQYRSTSSEYQQIAVLIKSIGRMQSKFRALREKIWNNTHRIKVDQIKKCGTVGEKWFKTHEAEKKKKIALGEWS